MTIARHIILIAALLAAIAVEASHILFVVRHSEKVKRGGNDPELSAGQQRAEALARMLLSGSEITV